MSKSHQVTENCKANSEPIKGNTATLINNMAITENDDYTYTPQEDTEENRKRAAEERIRQVEIARKIMAE